MAKGKGGKASGSGAVNADRKNGKAFKKNPGKSGGVGSRSVKLTEIQKVLMGKGLVVTYSKADAAERHRAARKEAAADKAE